MKVAASELVRAWGETWEVWELFPEPSRPPRLLDSASKRVAAKDRILAIPARRAVAAPLWVDSIDPTVIRESIELELEVRGLLPRRKSADAVFSRTLAVDGRTLVMCTVFPAEIPEPHAGKFFTHYEASPFLVSLAEDAVNLWREEEDLVAVFTRGSTVVYWATLDTPCSSKQVRHWLQMVLLHLNATGILTMRPQRVVLDVALEEEGFTGLIPDVPQQAWAFPPTVENGNFEWKPESARDLEQQNLSTRKTRQAVFAMVAAYLIIVFGAGVHLGWLSLKSRMLQNQIAELGVRTGEFEPTAREWRLVGPGAEVDYFPLETLHRVVSNLPSGGIRFTIYDCTEGRVSIEGEAESVSLASEFLTAISKDETLRQMNWQMPTPSLLPSNAARFQLTGLIP